MLRVAVFFPAFVLIGCSVSPDPAMYQSAVKPTEDEAMTLAARFLKRNPSLVLAPQLGGRATPATAILAAMVAS